LPFEAAADAAGVPVGLPVVIPPERLSDGASLDRLIDAVWRRHQQPLHLTPEITEARLLGTWLLSRSSGSSRSQDRAFRWRICMPATCFALHDLGLAAVAPPN
jgi:hypothetical protein